ncbi:hypothetical protein CSB45_07265 [candidate division KSB3 bacterium]|uniref:YtxH domain-containing protein n=1 Tax=candidate division KSB3 bacterium TaxID=2044937 RepID=A0A2G6E6P1_9BACT|nr:MAG: hypothetical protein CSB45_07265 [candidate division KSB3 bacterium]PIE29971.1 MAG: hypothetical protein CSA57_05330 [candidate division KSB3 bacterium]
MTQSYDYSSPQPYDRTGDQYCLTSEQPLYPPSAGNQQPSWAPFYQQGTRVPDSRFHIPSEATPATGFASWFNFSNSGYLKGFVLGAGIAILLTHPAVQRTLLASGIKVWSLFQGGLEEVKEQVHDIRAEMSQKSV